MSQLHVGNRIPGVSGFGHWAFIERLAGARSYKTGQLPEGASTTPWMHQKIFFADSYADLLFIKAQKQLATIQKSVLTEVKELLMLRKSEDAAPPPFANDEESLRLAAAKLEKTKADEERKETILLHLAGFKAELVSLDQVLNYNLDRVSSILFAHLGAYWQGVLKAANRPDLPPFPCIERKETDAHRVYEAYKAFTERVLCHALNNTKEGILYELVFETQEKH